ncbi:MAG: glycoside hydrolase family 3 protein [Spirochaetota bacterium]
MIVRAQERERRSARRVVHFSILVFSKFTTVFAIAAAAVSCAESPPAVSIPTRGRLEEWAIGRMTAALPAHALAGQLVIIGIENRSDGGPVLRLDEETRRLIADVRPGAAVLFGQTFATVDQVVGLVHDLHDASAIPPIVATDYEGGLVSRLTTTGGIPATRIPSAAVVGRAAQRLEEDGDRELLAVRELGRVMGSELRALGVTMDFAPVVDVDPAGATGAIGRHERTYGDDPVHVGRVGAAIATGLQDEGVAAVLKHFPGHGAVETDSHDELAVLAAPRTLIRTRELAAFEIALAAQPEAIMTAHLAVPGLTGTNDPASLSAAITAIARDELGFRGLIIADALNMRALTALAPEPELVVRAIESGADMVLKPLNARAARDALLDALRIGRLDRARLEQSVRRILRVKRRLGLMPLRPCGRADIATVGEPLPNVHDAYDVLGSSAHREVVERIMELAGERE